MKQSQQELFTKTTDYSGLGFIALITDNKVSTYASINPDMAPIDGMLVPTGSYYYLHPIYGSTSFSLNLFGNEPQSEDMPSYVEPDILEQIVKEIRKRENKI